MRLGSVMAAFSKRRLPLASGRARRRCRKAAQAARVNAGQGVPDAAARRVYRSAYCTVNRAGAPPVCRAARSGAGGNARRAGPPPGAAGEGGGARIHRRQGAGRWHATARAVPHDAVDRAAAGAPGVERPRHARGLSTLDMRKDRIDGPCNGTGYSAASSALGGGSGLGFGLGGLLGLLGLALLRGGLFLELLLAALRLLLRGGFHLRLAGGLALGLLGAGLLGLLLGLHVGGAVGVGHHGVREGHDAALAVGGLVLVDDALRGGLVHEAAGGAGRRR